MNLQEFARKWGGGEETNKNMHGRRELSVLSECSHIHVHYVNPVSSGR